MIHISEVSDGFIKDINDFLAPGEHVTVKVIKITDDGKINLSLRQAQEKKDTQPAPRPVQEKPAFQKKQEYKPQPKVAMSEAIHTDDFDKMMSRFLKDSEDNLSSLRRNTEGKRGGRGGRRN